MTALAFLKLGSRTLLLAGEGPLLRIYNQSTGQLLLLRHIFRGQSLHGICTRSTTNNTSDQNLFGEVLIWGGRSLCLVAIEGKASDEDELEVQIRQLVQEIRTDDWIFDARFSPTPSNSPVSSNTRVCKAVLVTANNALLALSLQVDPDRYATDLPSLDCIAAGPRSILYSAHVAWLRNGRGLVAAGTVFGEVLLWSFSTDEYFLISQNIVPGHLHYTFTGHEGSVFGVQISEEAAASDTDPSRRVLASCSDDRTIRIWDISSLELDAADNEKQESITRRSNKSLNDASPGGASFCLAIVMGHSSRIWGVRFLYPQRTAYKLMSYGEDGTAQIWQLKFDSSTSNSSKKLSSQTTFLGHQSTYAFHFGKNIWAMATIPEPNGGFLISTGGADGQIVSHFVKAEDMLWDSNSWAGQWSIHDGYMSVETAVDYSEAASHNSMALKRKRSTLKVLFQGLEGKWLIRRNLKSAIPTYLSGLFEGTAVFEARNPTDEGYDLEYLYIESGQFTTEQGFTTKATRRYAYRFQEKSSTITAWFVCTDDRSSIDYLFHALEFGNLSKNFESKEDSNIVSLSANGHHLCIDDDYLAGYVFQLKDAALITWELTYVVKGPSKDYITDARFVRRGNLELSNTMVEPTKVHYKTSRALTTPIEKMKIGFGSFKGYAWISDECFMTSTEQGKLLVGSVRTGYNLPTLTWKATGEVNELKSSCVITRARFCPIILLGGKEGVIYIYQHPQQLHRITELPSKVASLSAQMLPPSSRYSVQEEKKTPFIIAFFVSCLRSSVAHFLIIGIKEGGLPDTQNGSGSSMNIETFQHVLIDLPPHFIVTSSLIMDSESLLILGSRRGRLSIYDLLPEAIDNRTYSCLSDNIHGCGEDVITTIESVPASTLSNFPNGIYILTTGRDGAYSIHQICVDRTEHLGTQINLQTVHTCAPPFGPNIEGAQFIESTGDLLLWGFRSKRFVVWNETQKSEMMNVECGGANRNWAYIPKNDDSGGGNVVWTKASICSVQSQARASHQVFQHGGHGREIKAMAISPHIVREKDNVSRFIATGAEDTAIRVFSYDSGYAKNTHQGFKCLGIFTNHKTGIQQLKWSPNGKYLFSAAGLEEFLIWRVRSVPCIGIGMVCEARFPPVSEACDLRITDFDIMGLDSESDENRGLSEHQYILTLVYSDSSLRVCSQCQTFLLDSS